MNQGPTQKHNKSSSNSPTSKSKGDKAKKQKVAVARPTQESFATITNIATLSRSSPKPSTNIVYHSKMT